MKTVILGTCLALGASVAHAEMFKCGTSFQDHPCQVAAPTQAQTKEAKKEHKKHHHHEHKHPTSTPAPTTPAPAPTPTPTPKPTPAPAPTPTPKPTPTPTPAPTPTPTPTPTPAPTPTPTPTGPAGAAGCGLASAAFCETFETPSPGGNGGDLDETRWAVSRWGIGYNHGQTFYRPVASTQSGYDVSSTFCGSPFSNIAVLQDFKFCNGVDGKGVASKQLHEVLQDGGDNIYVNSMMTRQPFDFAGRTGTIVWDVDAKIFPRNDGHGWWTEMWISEDPGPIPYQQEFPSVDSVARNSFGLVFQGTNWWDSCNKANMMNGVTAAIVSNNYHTRDLISFTDMLKAPYGCFKVADSKLNHFELRINTDTAELYASDAGVPSSLRLVFRVSGLNLNFTRGYVSFQHTHYNARKSPVGTNQPGTTPSQTYRWDNIGFDGPVINPLRGYDVPLPVRVADGASAFGFPITPAASMSVSKVDLTGATKAYLNFNVFPTLDIAYSLNGNAWHTVKDPMGSPGNWRIRSMSIPVSLSELHPGVNSISIKSAGTATPDLDSISNVDISIQY